MAGRNGERERSARGVYEAHPVADAFPMLSDTEMVALADDIAEHGLRQPIVVQSGVLIDGRNRAAACAIAGVVPDEVELDADVDPVAFIMSVNLGRRHMSKGAMAISIALAEDAAGGFAHGRKSELSSGFGISDRYLRMARTVVEKDLVIGDQRCFADSVTNGSMSLREAYDEVNRDRCTLDQAMDLEFVRDRAASAWTRICWILATDPAEYEGHPAWDFIYARFQSIAATPPEAAIQAADAVDGFDNFVEYYRLRVLEAS